MRGTVSFGTDDLVDVCLWFEVLQMTWEQRSRLASSVYLLYSISRNWTIAKFFCLLFDQLKDNLPSISPAQPKSHTNHNYFGIPRVHIHRMVIALVARCAAYISRTFTKHKTLRSHLTVAAVFEPHQWLYCIFIFHCSSTVNCRCTICEQRLRLLQANNSSSSFAFQICLFINLMFMRFHLQIQNRWPPIVCASVCSITLLFQFCIRMCVRVCGMHAFIECSSHAHIVIIGNIQKAKKNKWYDYYLPATQSRVAQVNSK